MKRLCAPKTASKGIVMGTVSMVMERDLSPDIYKVSDIIAEVELFKDAVSSVAEQMKPLAKDNEIMAAHLELLHDIALHEGIIDKIETQNMNAQQAVDATILEFATIFDLMEDEYMKARSADIKDVGNRLLLKLKGLEESNFNNITEKVILVARDLAPSDTAKLNLDYILGFITELGGVTSHVSIMAKSQGLPALVGVKNLMQEVKHGDFVIMNASSGEILINPDQDIMKEYEELQREFQEKQNQLMAAAHLKAVTKDGHEVKVCANVGNVADVITAVQHHVDGVGLFRSEFLYMENTHFPTEEEQYAVYHQAALECKGEVIIRTLDIGGDKELSYFDFEKEDNPFLGYRAIRICLDIPEIFKTQLRALLRASVNSDIRIMYPMIISLEELKRANEILDICKKELDSQGIAYNKEIKVGMMIETPASVMSVDCFAKYVDFFSIGTNDLTQYLLVVDRGNKKIASMYNSFHPAVLHAVQKVIDAGHANNIPVGMCGEFASDEKAVKVLLGMGLDEFSVAAFEAANIKSMIRNTDYMECKNMAKKVKEAFTIEEVMQIINE